MILIRRHASSLLLFLSMLSQLPLRANMAAPLQPGAALGEPQAQLSGLVIEREQLRIDLRPLALEPPAEGAAGEGFGRALISAIYHVRNDSLERPLTLEFVAEAIDTAQWSVSIDGHPVAARYRLGDPEAPVSFLPKTTPGLDGRPLEYEASAAGILRFDALLSPGRHTIRVEYVAEATRQVVDHPLVHWQLGYILEPARRWPEFGGLDVTVLTPSGWSLASEPALVRRGDRLGAHFDGIPADALTMTVRGRYEWWYPVVAWMPAVVALLVGGVAAFRLGRGFGRRLARNGKGAGWALPAALGAAFVLSVTVPAVGLAGAELEEALIGPGQRAWGDYSFLFIEVLLALLALVAGIAMVQLGAVRSLRRSRRRYDARWVDAYPDDTEPPGTIYTNGSVSERS